MEAHVGVKNKTRTIDLTKPDPDVVIHKNRVSDLKIAFGQVTEKNLELIRTLNLAIFPVIYNDGFYHKLMIYEKFCRLGKR